MPLKVSVEKLECGKTFGKSLIENKVKYHKYYRLKFGKKKLEEVTKVVKTVESGKVNGGKTRGTIVYLLYIIGIFNPNLISSTY